MKKKNVQPQTVIWQPIETAPKDGTTILSDSGTVRYLNLDEETTGWYLIGIGNYSPPRCVDEGYNISYCGPKWWMPIPELP
jgi:hypothetical protein